MTSKKTTVLVVNASGALGGIATRLLLEEGYTVRAFVRADSRAKIDALVRLGAEPVLGDLKDPATLVAACQGVDKVISCATAIASQNPTDTIERVDSAGQTALVKQAELAGVSHFVFISFAEQGETFPLQSAKRAVEARLRQSAMGFTILHPAVFQEVWLSPALGFDYVEGRVRLFGDGHGKINWISTLDVAEAAVACLRQPSTLGRTIELAGPEPLSAHEVVQIFEEMSGRVFEKEHVPDHFLKSQMTETSDPQQQSFFALARQIARGYQVRSEPIALLAQTTRSVRDYALSVLKKS